MALPAAGLYTRYRHLIPELLKFCVVGGLGAVIDLGGAAVLHGKFHVEGLEAKAISTILATVVTYLGSRFWTFKHRENQALGREATLFIVLNVIGLAIAEVVIALVTYGFGRVWAGTAILSTPRRPSPPPAWPPSSVTPRPASGCSPRRLSSRRPRR